MSEQPFTTKALYMEQKTNQFGIKETHIYKGKQIYEWTDGIFEIRIYPFSEWDNIELAKKAIDESMRNFEEK